MDTKSKNIKYSYGTKVLAFFVALALVVSSGVLIASSIDMMMKFASDDYLSIINKSEFSYSDSIAFENEIENQLNNISKVLTDTDFTTYVNGTYCTKEEEIELASKYYDYAVSSPYSNDYAYSYDENDEEVTYLVSSVYEMKINKDKINFTADMTKDAFLKNVSDSYDDAIVSASRSCANEKIVAQNTLDSLVNLKYYVQNIKTGEIITNTTPEQIKAAKDGWFFEYKAESGIIDSSFETNKTSYFSYYSLGKKLDKGFGDKNYNVMFSLPKAENIQQGDTFYSIEQNCSGIKNNVRGYATASAIMLIIAFVLSVYLVMVSGRTVNSDTPQISWVDRIPTDLHFVISWGLVILLFCGAVAAVDELWNSLNEGYYSQSEAYLLILAEAGLFGTFWSVILEWATHVSRFYKTKRPYVRNSLIGIIFIAFIKFCKEVINAVKHIFGLGPKKLKKKAFWILLVFAGANCVCACFLAGAINGNGFSVFTSLLIIAFVNLVMLILMWKYLLALDAIVEAAEKGKGGEPPEKINSDNFPEPLKSLADNLYVTQDEMKKAVDEAVKGERMKTELITNVSHDLKTPLTAIISYVDLLKKCDIDDIQAQQYIDVLDDKSIRLKRLIEDLVEASKVSSGVVTFNKMNVSLKELAVQAIAEVEDGFASKNLEIVFDENAVSPIVFADSQKTWRVIDNLLSNARKYSLAGSRIYVEIGATENTGFFSIKNVSQQALNINAEELTQRFVRGDASRTNEGSGLGLSIAKDLCSLQGGSLTIDIDGDLFKATIELPLAKIEEPAQPEQTENQPE